MPFPIPIRRCCKASLLNVLAFAWWLQNSAGTSPSPQYRTTSCPRRFNSPISAQRILHCPGLPPPPPSEGMPSSAPESMPVTGDVVAADVVAPEPVAAIANQQHPISVVTPLAYAATYEAWSP